MATAIWENIPLVLLDKVLYLTVVLDNDHLLSLDYEHGMLKDMIAALESDTPHSSNFNFRVLARAVEVFKAKHVWT